MESSSDHLQAQNPACHFFLFTYASHLTHPIKLLLRSDLELVITYPNFLVNKSLGISLHILSF